MYHMVRIMAGTLLEIGSGERRPEEIKTILESGDRQMAGVMAPALGLCLMEVEYLTEKILIVEDDGMIASGLTYALEQEGFETAVAGSCAAFRQIYHRNLYYGYFRHYPA